MFVDVINFSGSGLSRTLWYPCTLQESLDETIWVPAYMLVHSGLEELPVFSGNPNVLIKFATCQRSSSTTYCLSLSFMKALLKNVSERLAWNFLSVDEIFLSDSLFCDKWNTGWPSRLFSKVSTDSTFSENQKYFALRSQFVNATIFRSHLGLFSCVASLLAGFIFFFSGIFSILTCSFFFVTIQSREDLLL